MSDDTHHITIDISNPQTNPHIKVDEEVDKYTDNHFIHKLNQELEKIRMSENLRMKRKSISLESNGNGHSPIFISNYNSEEEDAYNEENYLEFEEDVFNEESDENLFRRIHSFGGSSTSDKKPLKKLSFRDVKKSIHKYYDIEDKYYNELDILTTYLKGQKNLYMKSKTVTQTKLNLIMIPSLIGTSIITITAPIIQNYVWSGAFISGLNAVVAFLISIIHYFKLESCVNTYSHLTSQYDKLENSIEFTNNKMSLIENVHERNDLVLTKMKEIEKKINEIKETIHNIHIPQEIKRIFPIICNVNIFSFIKRIEVYNKNLIVKLTDIKNEILYIKWNCEQKMEMEPKEKKRLEFLYEIKDKIKDEILHYRNAYSCIDELFIKEINRADNTSVWSVWFSLKRNIGESENPVLKEYLSTIFSSH
jgi:hypothetical protein